ncbi:unnamed protein product, partial [Prorocentrum cordatum]
PWAFTERPFPLRFLPWVRLRNGFACRGASHGSGFSALSSRRFASECTSARRRGARGSGLGRAGVPFQPAAGARPRRRWLLQRSRRRGPLRRALRRGDRRPHADPPQRGIPGHHRHRAARDSRGGRLDGGAEVAGVREQVLRRQQAPPKGRPEGREGRHRVRAGDERHAPDAAHLRRAGLLHLHGGPCRLRRVLHLAGASAHGQARPLHEGAHPREAHLERWPRQREAHAPGPLHGDPAGLLRGGRLQRAHRQRHQPSRRAPPRHQQGAGPRGQDARGLPG